MLSALSMTLPDEGMARSGGSKAEKRAAARSEKPLNTDITVTIASDATATPHSATIEMMLTALWLLGANR